MVQPIKNVLTGYSGLGVRSGLTREIGPTA